MSEDDLIAKAFFALQAMSNQLITKTYKDLTFTFRADGYFNMTKAAACFGKRLDSFMKSPETKEYIDALASIHTNRGSCETKRGNGGGTWAHPKLAIFFARWLDVRFAVWCDAMIEDILKGNAEVLITKPKESAVMALPSKPTPPFANTKRAATV